MHFITWKESFSVGVPSIDDQHKKLVGMINRLYSEFSNGITNKFLEEIIQELQGYTEYHFSYEEKFMQLYHFDDYKEHKAEHNLFIDKINQYKETLAKENKKEVIDFITFLKNWLLKHIMGTDKKYMKLFQDKGMH
ncbi:MAG: bacteriohemerythrin [Bacteroidales bacterium]|jgi:hemerythrin|nr:bacteriohemerythrin [Bacteroidales bacterium]